MELCSSSSSPPTAAAAGGAWQVGEDGQPLQQRGSGKERKSEGGRQRKKVGDTLTKMAGSWFKKKLDETS